MIGEHIQEADANPGWGFACCPQPDACTNCHTPYLVSRIEQTAVAEDPGRASLIDKEERSMAEDSPPWTRVHLRACSAVASSRSLRTASRRPGIRKIDLDGSSRKCPDLGCEFRDSLLLAGGWTLRTGGHAAGGITLAHQMLALAHAPVRHSDLS